MRDLNCRQDAVSWNMFDKYGNSTVESRDAGRLAGLKPSICLFATRPFQRQHFFSVSTHTSCFLGRPGFLFTIIGMSSSSEVVMLLPVASGWCFFGGRPLLGFSWGALLPSSLVTWTLSIIASHSSRSRSQSPLISALQLRTYTAEARLSPPSTLSPWNNTTTIAHHHHQQIQYYHHHYAPTPIVSSPSPCPHHHDHHHDHIIITITTIIIITPSLSLTISPLLSSLSSFIFTIINIKISIKNHYHHCRILFNIISHQHSHCYHHHVFLTFCFFLHFFATSLQYWSTISWHDRRFWAGSQVSSSDSYPCHRTL